MLKELIIKDVKNTLRDLKVVISAIILPFITFSIMGIAISAGAGQMAQEVTEKVRAVDIIVCDEDTSNYSTLYVSFLKKVAGNVTRSTSCSTPPEDLLSQGYDLVVVIPGGFGENISREEPADVEVYTKVKGVSMTAVSIVAAMVGVVRSAADMFSSYLLTQAGVKPEFAFNPLRIEPLVMLRGEVIDLRVLESIASSMLMLIFAPLVAVSSALGMAATSMAKENEEKTMEVLLTLPVPRIHIVLSKLVGTMTLVAFSTISYMGGFAVYVGSIMAMVSTPEEGEAAAPGFGSASFVDPALLVLFGAVIFISLMAVAALGILLGSIAPDSRAVGTYIGPVSMVVMIPAFILMFVDLSSLSPAGQVALLLTSPFTAAVIVVKAWFEGAYTFIATTIGVSLAFVMVLLYLSSALLGSEKLLSLQYRFQKMRSGKGRKKERGIFSKG